MASTLQWIFYYFALKLALLLGFLVKPLRSIHPAGYNLLAHPMGITFIQFKLQGSLAFDTSFVVIFAILVHNNRNQLQGRFAFRAHDNS